MRNDEAADASLLGAMPGGDAPSYSSFRIHHSSFLHGRRALHRPLKRDGQRHVEEVQVLMPERVTIKRVRIPFAESLRFPGEGKSAQG